MTRLRRFTQALGLFLGYGYLPVITSGHIYKGSLKGFCIPFLSCYACPTALFACPIGSLQHFMAIHSLPILLIGVIGLIGATVGRMTCGWICPFGLLQDLVHQIPCRKIQIPRPLSLLKYLSLILLVLLVPYLSGDPWFSRLCPLGTLSAGIPWAIFNPRDPVTGQTVIGPGDLGALFGLKLVILAGFLILFAKAKRPFCRTACPLGALFSLFNRLSLVQLKVSDGCRGCGRCRARCPVDLQVSLDANSPECVRCLSCTECKNVSVEIRFAGAAVLNRSRDPRA